MIFNSVLRFLFFLQDMFGISFYFIVSGSVIVERMEEDKSTGEKHKQVLKANGMSEKFNHS